jgi:hypothetical protein
LYLTKGASLALGLDPNETNVDIAVSISRDGGQRLEQPAQHQDRQAVHHQRPGARLDLGAG